MSASPHDAPGRPPGPETPGSPGKPSRVRYGVVAFGVTLAIITYIDRVAMSTAVPFISKDLSIGKIEMGYVFSAFAWTYGLFEIPWGWLGDRIGPRKLLMRVVIWWSCFTAATGLAWSHLSLLFTQALFGAGEAGAFPNVAKAFTTWLTSRERVWAQGVLWLSARWGGAFTPLLVVLVLKYVTWRVAFGIFASFGLVWAVLFYLWYRDTPAEHPKVNEQERELLREATRGSTGDPGPVPWRRFLSSSSFWMLCWQYFFLAYGAFFYITWLPTYLQEARHVELEKGAFLSAFPLFFAGLGSLFCGFFLARLAEWIGGPLRARRTLALVGFFSACALLVISTRIGHPLGAMAVMGMAGFANDLAMPPSWAASMDMGGRFAGTLSAAMNMMSCMGAAVSAWVTAHILEWSGNDWNLVLYASAGAYFAGGLFWIFLDPVTPLDRVAVPTPDRTAPDRIPEPSLGPAAPAPPEPSVGS